MLHPVRGWIAALKKKKHMKYYIPNLTYSPRREKEFKVSQQVLSFWAIIYCTMKFRKTFIPSYKREWDFLGVGDFPG